MRKVILYIAMSLDGFIAKENDDISFLDSVVVENEDYGYKEFYQTIDTVIMGRKTYDKVNSLVEEFPHKNLKTYIISKSKRESFENTEFYNGDLKDLIDNLKSKEGKNIFVDGGAAIVNLLMEQNLIDEMIVSIIPIILGNGIRLFNQENEKKIKLNDAKQFDSGLVKLHYLIK